MSDIECVQCGMRSATPMAHANHVCRFPEQRMAVQFAQPARGPQKKEERKTRTMAGVILCDRDGSITTERAAGTIEIQLSPEREPETFSLCPSCVKELWSWFKATDDAKKALPTFVKPFDPDEVAEPIVDQKATTTAALEAEYGGK